MTETRTLPLSHLATAIEAAIALEEEVDPTTLWLLADEVEHILPALARDLIAKARRGGRLRRMLASAGDMPPGGES
jgi:hypothetical protein